MGSGIFYADKQRNNKGHALRYIYFLRKSQCSSKPMQWFYRWILKRMMLRYGLEIPWNLKVGKGLYLGHAYNITINPDAVIGKWCNIHKGVTIGRQNRGYRKGAPTIGDRVWVGVNATVVGKVTIGDDVLIAPNAFVNFDVPSHSVVVGNPAQVHSRENATEGYVNNTDE